MALYGYIDDLARILAGDPRFTEAFAYLRRCLDEGSPEIRRLRGLPEGAVESIPLGRGNVAMEQVYKTRERKNCFFESHRANIDVQAVLEGEEVMDIVPSRDLPVERPYIGERDVVIYKDPGAGSRLVVRPGQAAIFFPEDGHMPGQFLGGPAVVRKTVVKVPVVPESAAA